MNFEAWLEAVDAEFINRIGLDRDSWPDQDYWQMWSDGETPAEAVRAAVENEYGDMGLAAFYGE